MKAAVQTITSKAHWTLLNESNCFVLNLVNQDLSTNFSVINAKFLTVVEKLFLIFFLWWKKYSQIFVICV